MGNKDQPPLCSLGAEENSDVYTDKREQPHICLPLQALSHGIEAPRLICSNPAKEKIPEFSPGNPICAPQRDFNDGLGTAGLVWSSRKEENGAKAWERSGKPRLEKKPLEIWMGQGRGEQGGKKSLLPQVRGDPVGLSGTELKIKLKRELITRYIINLWNSLLHRALEKPNHEEFPKVWTNAGKTDPLVDIK